ncbi:unnamed protein product, partial [Didymodactylos carnosus]
MEETETEQFAQACFDNNLYLVELFLEQMTLEEINYQLKPDLVTALGCAAYLGNSEIISILLDHGASPTLKTVDGQTPFDFAQTKEIQQLFDMKIDKRNFDKFIIANKSNQNKKINNLQQFLPQTSIISTLEHLPDEIILEIFKHMKAIDIIRAFFMLNSRFNRIINDVKLNVDLENISKNDFDYNCEHILCKRYFQSQVHFLKLSNIGTWRAIDTFFDKFAIEQFTNLTCLTLIDSKSLLREILESLSSLRYLNTLIIQESDYPTDNTSSISNIVISDKISSLKKCVLLFDELVRLDNKMNCTHLSTKVPLLTHLNLIKTGRIYFEYIESLLENLPQLKYLSCSATDYDFADGERWEHTLSTLHSLGTFQFDLVLAVDNDVVTATNIISKFNQQWPMVYEHDEINNHEFLYIHTIPYPHSTLRKSFSCFRSANSLSNVYDKVEYLSHIVNSSQIISPNYYPNVHSLELEDEEGDNDILIKVPLVDTSSI